MAGYPTVACDCGDQMIWAVTVNGIRMPVNVEPAPDGNVRLVDRGTTAAPLAEVLPVAKRFGLQGTLRTSHFATCARADRHRRQR